MTVSFEGSVLPESLKRLIKEYNIGGVLLFRSHCPSLAHLQKLIAELKSLRTDPPLMIAIDHEGGRVHRLPKPFTHFPPMRFVKTEEQAEAVGEAMGRELGAVGIDIDFAPVLDVATNPLNKVIGDRAFDLSASSVAEMGVAFIRGLQKTGVAACGKHFPGHGDTDDDSHFVLPALSHNRKRLEQLEWVPFRAAIEEGVAGLMTAHILYNILDPGVMATLSVKIVRDILREDLQFPGVIFSDDLGMGAVAAFATIEEAAVLALNAGCDNLLLGRHEEKQRTTLERLHRAVESGEIPATVIEAAYRRVLHLKERFVIPKKEIPLSVIGCADHRTLARSLII